MILKAATNQLRILQNLCLCLAGIAVSLVAAEVVFRCFLLAPQVPRTEQRFQREVAATWPRHIPREKRPGSFRVLGLADSFGVYGGRENFYYLLEEKLQSTGSDYQLINFSQLASQLPDELEMLQRFGPAYAPDLILHSVYVGNDLAVRAGSLLTYRGVGVVKAPGIAAFRPHNLLFPQWLGNYFIVLKDRRAKRSEQAAQPEQEGMSQQYFLAVERKRLEMCRLDLLADTQGWEAVSGALDAISAQARAMNAVYVMVIHPDQFQVEITLMQQLQQQYQINLSQYDLLQPQRFLAQYCQSRHIPYIDLLPALREHGQRGGLYLLHDTHYNSQGNQLVAQEVFEFLQQAVLRK